MHFKVPLDKMKYYESTSNEYIQASKQFDLHPELSDALNTMPESLMQFGNIIFYGPSGVGKYTQFLRFVEAYSENRLKTDKMKVQTDKHTYEYHISDVHYEIDMALLGCESKKLWNDSFFQIVDVISTKKSKTGIILCKNFHAIHSELLEVFYSYIQHCRTLSIRIAFVLLTEHVSFIPNRILQCCKIIPVKRPEAKLYQNLNEFHSKFCSDADNKTHTQFTKNIGLVPKCQFLASSYVTASQECSAEKHPQIDPESLLNLKELRAHKRHPDVSPKDVFNIVCDNIINEMMRHEHIRLLELRDHLYDILLYGLDVTECLWYVLRFFAENDKLLELDEVLIRVNNFLKYYNNNYRPIYHLESIFIYLITKIHNYPNLNEL